MSDYVVRTGGIVPDRVGDMARRIEELERTVADLKRHNEQLREAISALLMPTTAEVLPKNAAHPSRHREV